MSVFYQKSNLEAGGDPLEAVKNNLSALKQLLEVKMQLIPIESVVRIEVILVNREQTRYRVEHCMHSLVRPCSP